MACRLRHVSGTGKGSKSALFTALLVNSTVFINDQHAVSHDIEEIPPVNVQLLFDFGPLRGELDSLEVQAKARCIAETGTLEAWNNYEPLIKLWEYSITDVLPSKNRRKPVFVGVCPLGVGNHRMLMKSLISPVGQQAVVVADYPVTPGTLSHILTRKLQKGDILSAAVIVDHFVRGRYYEEIGSDSEYPQDYLDFLTFLCTSPRIENCVIYVKEVNGKREVKITYEDGVHRQNGSVIVDTSNWLANKAISLMGEISILRRLKLTSEGQREELERVFRRFWESRNFGVAQAADALNESSHETSADFTSESDCIDV